MKFSVVSKTRALGFLAVVSSVSAQQASLASKADWPAITGQPIKDLVSEKCWQVNGTKILLADCVADKSSQLFDYEPSTKNIHLHSDPSSCVIPNGDMEVGLTVIDKCLSVIPQFRFWFDSMNKIRCGRGADGANCVVERSNHHAYEGDCDSADAHQYFHGSLADAAKVTVMAPETTIAPHPEWTTSSSMPIRDLTTNTCWDVDTTGYTYNGNMVIWTAPCVPGKPGQQFSYDAGTKHLCVAAGAQKGMCVMREGGGHIILTRNIPMPFQKWSMDAKGKLHVEWGGEGANCPISGGEGKGHLVTGDCSKASELYHGDPPTAAPTTAAPTTDAPTLTPTDAPTPTPTDAPTPTPVTAEIFVASNNSSPFQILPASAKPAVEPVSFQKMTKKEPQGLVSGSGVCTSINSDMEFVPVNCSVSGSIELIYNDDTKQLQLVQRGEKHQRALQQQQQPTTKSSDLCLQNQHSKARFVKCVIQPDTQWYNNITGKIMSFKDKHCLDMPTTTEKTAKPMSILPCVDSPTQQWKLQVKPQTTPTGSATGDPHFKTFSSEKYDFHGGCDLVLLDNPSLKVPGGGGEGLIIHIRTEISSWWSYIKTAAVKIGSDVLEVSGGADGGTFWINGVMQGPFQDGSRLFTSSFQVALKKVSAIQHRFRIDFGKGDSISLETYKSFVQVNVRAKSFDQFQGSVGLMGTYPAGMKMARNGTTILEDPKTFGQEWQVRASEPRLFHSYEGAILPPNKCAMPDDEVLIQKRGLRRRLGAAAITEEDAEQACAHVAEDDHDACIFDVLATNDKEMAATY